MKRYISLAWALLACMAGKAQQQAFPGAEGFGKYASGGRNGKVIIVSNLNDAGPGSLRAAINTKGPRTVVFSVSGTIALQSPIRIKEGNLTIAGQSAPGDGICIKNYNTYVDADNVIIRYMRFRLGDETRDENDAFGGRFHDNIIIDHCSVSWSIDECASFYGNSNFTMQWCLVAEALNNSFHSKGPHGYGGIWGGRKASFHHNILASNKSRNPRFSGSATTQNTEEELVDFRNNVVYNWGANSTYGGEKGKYNMVNNYYKPGPATHSKLKGRIVNPSEPYGRFFVKGNYVDGNPAITASNSGGVECADPAAAIVSQPFAVMDILASDARTAYEQVLKGAGASLHRDAVDARIVKEIRSGRSASGKDGNGIIDSQADVGGWPALQSAPAPADSDGDGMPDEWEKAHGLDPRAAADQNGHQLDPGYTNVEVYLNGLIR